MALDFLQANGQQWRTAMNAVPAFPVATPEANFEFIRAQQPVVTTGDPDPGKLAAFFAAHPALSPEWRLLVITGFLGGLTTFSTFSAEVTTLLQQGRLLWACASISAHVAGSLLMTLLGMASVATLQRL